MRRAVRLTALLGGVFVACVSLSGCIVAADLINPNALRFIGFDPNTVRQPAGNVIVVFENTTDQLAIFAAYHQSDASDPLTAVSFQVEADPRSEPNQVLPCPIGALSLGAPGDTAGVGALVGAAAVNYTGDPLVEGVDYTCGDLIRFTLRAVPGAQAAFVIEAQVLPGR